MYHLGIFRPSTNVTVLSSTDSVEGRRVGAKIEGFGNVLLMFLLQIQGKKELFFLFYFIF